ncbi:MAG: pilus assembly protein [Pirellula sp.]|jgi:Flp pilus assembly protein TadG|nr:pilus assembly protein [Pirellula sp.]
MNNPSSKFSAKSIRATRSGATTVEFAMVAPVAFLLLFGALELGHANMVFHSAEAAAYEGARKGIIPGATAAECIAEANDMLQLCRVRGATVTVNPATLSPNDANVTVRVQVPYRSNSIVVPFFTRSLVINRECKLSRERGN